MTMLGAVPGLHVNFFAFYEQSIVHDTLFYLVSSNIGK